MKFYGIRMLSPEKQHNGSLRNGKVCSRKNELMRWVEAVRR
jgi:hypothetical protein